MTKKTEESYLYHGCERFWHWVQAILVILMAFTGFEIHGSYHVLGFEQAAQVHEISAWVLFTLWVFSLFWHLVTGEFRHYIPSREGVFAQLMYYIQGIFSGSSHPFSKSSEAKHNPLQRIAYFFLTMFLNPFIWITGGLYLFYNEWNSLGLSEYGLSLELVALLHTAMAFFMLTFLIVHLYLITTGETIGQYMKAMITGWEEVQVEDNPETDRSASSTNSADDSHEKS